MTDPLAHIHDFKLSDAPPEVINWAKLLLLDLSGVAIGGSDTKLSGIINQHAATMFGGTRPMLFSDQTASPAGVALAAGMTIDSLDGHDGFNTAKGHVGCALIAGILAMAPEALSGDALLEATILGYELGSRLGPALHATAPDYHTSGAWMAVCVAAIGARLSGLSRDQTAHAIGIAEYHGPRSQMMRVIDHPTMLKDGSGWGAMTGVSACDLARIGFTGAPAITMTETPKYWSDLGTNWLITAQYIKPYPVCRWAHAPVEAALNLRRDHNLTAKDITSIEIETFHESIRLACATPKTTEEAQYSTSFPVAVALAKGAITPADIADGALTDPQTLRLSKATTMLESDHANTPFPARRLARVKLTLESGNSVQSEWYEPKWDPSAPPTAAEIRAKFDAGTTKHATKAAHIADAISALPNAPYKPLRDLLLSRL
jgi:2-methylcitrate dehydratase PrpD